VYQIKIVTDHLNLCISMSISMPLSMSLSISFRVHVKFCQLSDFSDIGGVSPIFSVDKKVKIVSRNIRSLAGQYFIKC
jgi:hypothetical protein